MNKTYSKDLGGGNYVIDQTTRMDSIARLIKILGLNLSYMVAQRAKFIELALVDLTRLKINFNP